MGNDNNEESELIFHYNRARRLEKASQRVRDLYDKPIKKPTLFSSLTDSKPKAAMFTVIVAMCLLILFFTFLMPAKNTSLGGNSVAVSAMRYNGSTFIVLKKEAQKKEAYTGIVSVQSVGGGNSGGVNVNAENAAGGGESAGGGGGGEKIYNNTIVFSDVKSEEFRWTLPFESPALKIFLQAGPDSISVDVKSE